MNILFLLYTLHSTLCISSSKQLPIYYCFKRYCQVLENYTFVNFQPVI